MKSVIAVPLTSGSDAVVLVEVDEDQVGYERAATKRPEELFGAAGASVQGALEKVIRPTLEVIQEQLHKLSPAGIEIEFGIRLSGKAGAIIASTEVEGNVKVKLIWGAGQTLVASPDVPAVT